MNEYLMDTLQSFSAYATSQKLSTTAQLLWIKLFLLSYQSGWQESFSIPNKEIASLIACDVRMLRNARNNLVTSNLIKYENRGTRFSGNYIIRYPFLHGLDTNLHLIENGIEYISVPNPQKIKYKNAPNNKKIRYEIVSNKNSIKYKSVPNNEPIKCKNAPNPNPQKQPKRAKNKALQPCSPTHGIIHHTSNTSSNNNTSNIFNNNYINNINTSTTTRTTTTSLIDNTENYAEIYNPKWLEFIQTFEEQIGTLPCGTEFEKLEVFYKEFGHEVMLFAMEYVNSRNPSAPYPYLKKILKNWSDKGVKTLQDAKTASVKYTKPSLQNAPQFGEADLKLMNGECPF